MHPLDDWPDPEKDKFYTDWMKWPKLGPEQPLNAEYAEFHQWLYRRGAYVQDGGPLSPAAEVRAELEPYAISEYIDANVRGVGGSNT